MENELAGISAPVTMWVTSGVEMIPDTLAYGVITVGAQSTETITFVSASSDKYTISKISFDGVQGSVEQIVPNETYRCTVTADRDGNQSGQLRIAVDLSDREDSFELVKPVSYCGVPLPELKPQPTSGNYGSP